MTSYATALTQTLPRYLTLLKPNSFAIMATRCCIAGTGVNPDGLYPETLQLLLQMPGLDLHTADTSYGRTAAHWAVFYKRHDLLVQLILAGVSVSLSSCGIIVCV